MTDSQDLNMKESFVNDIESNAIVDYLAAFPQDMVSLAIMTPYRT